MNEFDNPRAMELLETVQAVFTEHPAERFTYSKVCYAIGVKRKAGLVRISPTFSACKRACEELVTQGKIKKEVNGRRAWYGGA